MIYRLDGTYEKGTDTGTLTGRIETDDDGKVRRGYCIDHHSPIKDRILKGKFKISDDGVTTLNMIVLVPNPNFLDLHYTLTRVEHAEDFSGDYFGVWTPLPRKISRTSFTSDSRFQDILEVISEDSTYRFLVGNINPDLVRTGAITLTKTDRWRD